jgi:hypothetical protein
MPLQRVAHRLSDFDITALHGSVDVDLDVVDHVEHAADAMRCLSRGDFLCVGANRSPQQHHALVRLYLNARLLNARIPVELADNVLLDLLIRPRAALRVC